MKLYYSPNSCALATHITLEKCGADYQAHRLDFSRGEQRSPEYLKVNPKGRVPALVTDHGILTETPAILAWLAQTHPRAKLAPLDDPYAFAQAQSFNSYLCSTVHVNHAHRRRGSRWADDPAAIEDMKRKSSQTVGDAFRVIEDEMLRGPWVLGDDFSICDIYLFTMSSWLEGDEVDTTPLPRVLDHRRRVGEDPQVAKVVDEENAAA